MYSQEVLDHPPFQLHIEPASPIELGDMLKALGAIERQFEEFVVAEKLSPSKDAKLLVSSVKPGSIDIGLLPDYATLGSIMAPAMVYSAPVLKFVAALKGLLDKFRVKSPSSDASIKECQDAIAITNPIAKSGGVQTFNVFNGTVYQQVFRIGAEEAREINERAASQKAILEAGNSEVHQRVAMVWYGMDTGVARVDGKRSPDKAIIEDIDKREKPVFFQDEFAHLKRAMIDDEENPYKKVYFVDVAVSHAAGKIVSYRIIGYHGSDDLTEDSA